MLPVLTFAAGLIVGAAGYRALKKSKSGANLRAAGDIAREGLDKAQCGLRQAAVSGLGAVERSSANLRVKLETAAEAPPAAETPATETPAAEAPATEAPAAEEQKP